MRDILNLLRGVALPTLAASMMVTSGCGRECKGTAVKSRADLRDLIGCEVMTGNLTITGTTLQSLDNLKDLRSIDGSLRIEDNPLLADVRGLRNLKSLVGITIVNNDMLEDLRGLAKARLGSNGYGFLLINDNQALRNVDGLSADLGDIEDVEIHNNPALTNLNGMVGLSHIEYALSVMDNASLTSIEGLRNLISCSEVDCFWVINNPRLPECQADQIADRLQATCNCSGNGSATCE